MRRTAIILVTVVALLGAFSSASIAHRRDPVREPAFQASARQAHHGTELRLSAAVLHAVRGTPWSAVALVHLPGGAVSDPVELVVMGRSYVAFARLPMPVEAVGEDVTVEVTIVYGGVPQPEITVVAEAPRPDGDGDGRGRWPWPAPTPSPSPEPTGTPTPES